MAPCSGLASGRPTKAVVLLPREVDRILLFREMMSNGLKWTVVSYNKRKGFKILIIID